MHETKQKMKYTSQSTYKLLTRTRTHTHAPHTQTYLELRAKPKIDDGVFVELTPDVHHRQNHGIHKDFKVEDKADNDAAQPIEEPHEGVVGGSTVKQTFQIGMMKEFLKRDLYFPHNNNVC